MSINFTYDLIKYLLTLQFEFKIGFPEYVSKKV